MGILSKLTVSKKLAVAFTSVLVLMALLGGLAVLQLSKVYSQAEHIITYRVSGVRDSGRMLEAANRLRIREYRLAVSKPEEVANSLDHYQKGLANFEKARKDYADFLANDKEMQLFEAADAA